ncbi:hypothetical protein [Aquiflexum sp.]|uniref:hypothetical protein n=1 Tax=Aquiflexum sp. TaxID=1872584 RepID=UPI003593437F
MELEKIYFFTATIHNWIPLFNEGSYKKIILSSLKYLSDKQLIKIYGFVIMPNHTDDGVKAKLSAFTYAKVSYLLKAERITPK